MIKTEIFCCYNESNYVCFEEALGLVNDLIKTEHIKRSDILEYRTKNWNEIHCTIDVRWYYEVTISYWVDIEEEDDQ